MGKVIAKRFIFMIPVVLAVTFIIFMLSFISAGDAARVLAEKKYEHPSPEQIEEVRHEEGLDQPVLVQYGKWLDQALHGDFGKSYSTRKPAFEELKRYFPQTFKLAVTSFLLLMIVSVPLGILSAIYENRVLDKVIRILSSLSVSMPSFWIGLMLLYIFGVKLKVISVIGGDAGGIPILAAFAWISVFWNYDEIDPYQYDTGAEAGLHTCQQSQGIVICKCNFASWSEKYSDSCADTSGINCDRFFLWLSCDRKYFFNSGNRKSGIEIRDLKRHSSAAMFYLYSGCWHCSIKFSCGYRLFCD